VRIAEQEHPDLVLMDIMIPELDGLAATHAIRALPGVARRIPIIGLTASVAAQDEATGRAAGVTGFAAKPITEGKLREVIGATMIDAVGHASGDHHVTGADPGPDNEMLIDPAAFARLREAVGTETLREAVAEFAAFAQNTIASQQRVGATDRTAIRFQAHAPNGAARNLALTRLARLADDIGRQSQTMPPAAETHEKLAITLAETLEQLPALVRPVTAAE